MTVLLDPDGPVRAALPLKVYYGGYALGAPEWQLSSAGRLMELDLRSGRAPSAARIAVENAPAETEVRTGIGPDGAPGRPLVGPRNFGLHALVKVTAQPGQTEEVVFLGLVAAHGYDLGAERFVVEARDFRWLLEKIPVLGRQAYRPSSETYAFELAALPVFNAGGRADRYAAGDSIPAFAPPGSDVAGRWRRGDVWNYLRRYWNAAPAEGLISTAGWLDWPEAVEDGALGFLFEDDGESSPPELALGGLTLAGALDELLRGAGKLDWTLAPLAEGQAQLKVFSTLSPGESQRQVTLARGTPGGSARLLRPEVAGGELTLSADRIAARVRALGAPERYDVSFDTASGTLAPGWSSAHQAAWLALSEAERARQYPAVFARWVVPDDLDWTEVFDAQGEETVLGEERAREFGARLLSADGAVSGADGEPVRIRLQLWRSKDAGATWEPAPAGVAAAPLAGALGVELPAAARQELSRAPGAAPERWSWDGDDSPWDIRVTASLGADRRASFLAQKSDTGWPASERLVLESGFRFDARRKAWIPASGGHPVAEGGEPALFGAAAADPERDDRERLAAAAERRLSDLARPSWRGEVRLSALRADVAPGDWLVKLAGGGDRPDVEVRAAVRRLIWSVEDQTTAVGFGAEERP